MIIYTIIKNRSYSTRNPHALSRSKGHHRLNQNNRKQFCIILNLQKLHLFKKHTKQKTEIKRSCVVSLIMRMAIRPTIRGVPVLSVHAINNISCSRNISLLGYIWCVSYVFFVTNRDLWSYQVVAGLNPLDPRVSKLQLSCMSTIFVPRAATSATTAFARVFERGAFVTDGTKRVCRRCL